jgi:hypothetical protein
MKREARPQNDTDLEALRALPARDADPAVVADVRSTALAAFDAAHGGAGSRFSFLALRAWSRFGVPLGLAAVVCLYLRWAFEAMSGLYH